MEMGWGHGKRNPEWAKLEQSAKKLVAEHYRLMGQVVYEPLPKELDQEIPEWIARWN